MKLKVINSGSFGNAYLLENENETLLIECGVSIQEIKKAINFDVSKVVGCIVTHEHGDHHKSLKEVISLGIETRALADVYKNKGVFPLTKDVITEGVVFYLGNFKIMGFKVSHNVPCLGFLIEHPGCGRTIFVTDTSHVEYTFPALNNIIIEANFCHDIIKQKYGHHNNKEFLKNRIFKDHFSLRDCKEMLLANDLRKVQNIVLIHLSQSNSDANRFVKEIHELTGKNTVWASKGLEIDFNKDLF